MNSEPKAFAPGVLGHSQSRLTVANAVVAVHLVLAVVPLGMGVIPFSTLTLPLIWSLSALPYSQIMLLSIWLGMFPGKLIPKLLLAIFAVFYVTIWLAAGSHLLSEERSLSHFLSTYLRDVFFVLVSLAGLSVVMSGVSRWVGTIRYTNETDRELVESRPRYSLFSILAVSTAISLVLGLVRLSRASTPADDAPLVVAQMLLSIVAFALNLLATIWATLGAGRAQYRIVAVFVIAILLGFSMSVGVGNSPFAEPWWLFASSSLIVVVPTTIVALTLLYLRKLGFRLIPRNQQSEPEIKPSLWDTPTRL